MFLKPPCTRVSHASHHCKVEIPPRRAIARPGSRLHQETIRARQTPPNNAKEKHKSKLRLCTHETYRLDTKIGLDRSQKSRPLCLGRCAVGQAPRPLPPFYAAGHAAGKGHLRSSNRGTLDRRRSHRARELGGRRVSPELEEQGVLLPLSRS